MANELPASVDNLMNPSEGKRERNGCMLTTSRGRRREASGLNSGKRMAN
jgi:hypothetical protein